MPSRKHAPKPRPKIRPKAPAPAGFRGRDPSPVLDRYPPKPAAQLVRPPPRAAPPPPPLPSVPPVGVQAPAPAPPGLSGGLVRLEAPFDIEAFSRQLGETRIQIDVPREDLAEVLRRVAEFMSFGIYVYELSFRPAPGEQLKHFRIALNRVDYAGPQKEWVPFEDRGRSDSPFGPGRTGVR